jgi:hypothetical protein
VSCNDVASLQLRIIHEQAAAVRQGEIDENGNLKRSSTRPKIRQAPSESIGDRDWLLLTVVALWRADISFYLHWLSVAENNDKSMTALRLWDSPCDITVKISLEQFFRHLSRYVFAMRPDNPYLPIAVPWLTTYTWADFSILFASPSNGYCRPHMLTSACTNLLSSRADFESQRLWSNTVRGVLLLYTRDADVSPIKGVCFRNSLPGSKNTENKSS